MSSNRYSSRGGAARNGGGDRRGRRGNGNGNDDGRYRDPNEFFGQTDQHQQHVMDEYPPQQGYHHHHHHEQQQLYQQQQQEIIQPYNNHHSHRHNHNRRYQQRHQQGSQRSFNDYQYQQQHHQNSQRSFVDHQYQQQQRQQQQQQQQQRQISQRSFNDHHYQQQQRPNSEPSFNNDHQHQQQQQQQQQQHYAQRPASDRYFEPESIRYLDNDFYNKINSNHNTTNGTTNTTASNSNSNSNSRSDSQQNYHHQQNYQNQTNQPFEPVTPSFSRKQTTRTTAGSRNNNNNNNSRPAPAPRSGGSIRTGVGRGQGTEYHQPPPPPPRHVSHPARCPPLNLEFLFTLYHQRNVPHLKTATMEDQIATLQDQAFPTGLAALILQHAEDNPLRIWLLDNCGTMHTSDGHLVAQSAKGKVEINNCSRWEEIRSTVIWHADLAGWLQTPMAIRLLQDPGVQVGPQQLGISASKHYSSTEEVQRLENLMKKTRPVGAPSPINIHLREIFPNIEEMKPLLEETNKKMVLCVCTDSIPTSSDGRKNDPDTIKEFSTILLQLVSWPVQVVFRLSTDDASVVSFYRDLMKNNEKFATRLQVLDDYVSECKHVQDKNSWLNYGYPLHLCREEGIYMPVFEILSQRLVSPSELYSIINLIFGCYGTETTDVVPSFDTEYNEFRKYVQKQNKLAGVMWNPIKKKFVPWIDIHKLDKAYHQYQYQSTMKQNKNNNGGGGKSNVLFSGKLKKKNGGIGAGSDHSGNGEKCIIS